MEELLISRSAHPPRFPEHDAVYGSRDLVQTMETRVQTIGGSPLRGSSLLFMTRPRAGVPLLYSSTKSHFDILRVILAPTNGRSRFVRRVRIDCSAQIPPDDLRPVLNCCPNIKDFEAHGLYPLRRSSYLSRVLSVARQLQSFTAFFSNRGLSPLFGLTPINLSLFTNLQTLRIVAVASLKTVPPVFPQLSVLVLKCDDGSAHYYQRVGEWTIPSLRVFVCQWITTHPLHTLCRAFTRTVEHLEVVQHGLCVGGEKKRPDRGSNHGSP